MTLVFRESLNAQMAAGCQDVSCTHEHHRGAPLHLEPQCHPKEPLRLAYVGLGQMQVACAMCGQTIAHLAIASSDDLGARAPSI